MSGGNHSFLLYGGCSMDKPKKNKKDFLENKKKIRKNIINAAHVFKKKMSGRYVLYVFDDNSYIEVSYRKSSFAHLTGVKSDLNAFDFYNRAISSKLTFENFSFDSKRHPYDLAKKKTSRLSEIDKFISSDLIVLREVTTETITYKFGLTDTDLTLCFVENIDGDTKEKIDDYYIPASFRVGDNSIDKSTDGDFVAYIFLKNSIQNLPEEIQDKLDFNRLYGKTKDTD
jgi:hypothetical protein